MAPIARLVAGPAMAIENSAFALGGSLVKLATPPRRNRVIEETVMLNRRATSACANSWATTLTKKSRAVMAATMSVFCWDQVGYVNGKT
jgi:hypothetical protein